MGLTMHIYEIACFGMSVVIDIDLHEAIVD